MRNPGAIDAVDLREGNNAMFDAEKKPEALKVFDKLVDLTKKKGNCNF